MKEIKLTDKITALIDDRDFQWLSNYKWRISSYGYAIKDIFKNGKYIKKIFMHRLIIGARKRDIVDHIDGNPLNNQRGNLRIVTHPQSMRNRGKKKSSRGKYKGVYYIKKQKSWKTTIGKIQISGFRTEHQAALAYDLWAADMYGEFARLNFQRANSESNNP